MGRSWFEGANRTTSSAKSRDEILRSPNQTPSGPWLRLEILSIKIMNRTGDKGQPCRSPTCTGNRSDLLPAMRTKLLLRSYRDRTARSRGPPTPYSRSIPHRMPRGTRSNAFSRSTKHMWTGWANSHEPRIQEEQCGFRPGRGTLDQLYTLRRVVEGLWEFAQPVHMCFVDLEKAFDRVPRGILWGVLREYGVGGPLLRAVRSLYDRSRSLVRIAGSKSDLFPVHVGLRHLACRKKQKPQLM